MKDIGERETIVLVKKIADAFSFKLREAEHQYLNKTVTVSGIVTYIGPDMYGLPSVELSEDVGVATQVICVFAFANYLKLRKVTTLHQAVITGTVVGTFGENTIVMNECRILQS